MDHPTPTTAPLIDAAAPAPGGDRGAHRRADLAPAAAGPVRRFVALIAAAALLVGGLTVGAGAPAGAAAFPDVPEDHPFAVAIDWAVTTGVTAGYADGTFRPTAAVSRQAFAAFLARYDDGATASVPEACEGDGPFTDVPASHPFCAEITWLVDLGITTGFPDDTFRPTNPISRQAMAAFLTRYAADDEPDACEGDGPFTDVPATHPFCAEITWMVDQGITTGFDDNTFRPTSPISRQAAAAFLWRLAGEPTGATIRVSVSSKGQQASGLSGGSAISADGSTAAFASFAADLVDDDTNSAGDVFVHDLTTGETTRVSVASDGTQANGDSGHPSLSADGRYVAFHSEATNLANGAQSGDYQIYVHDRETRTTELVSVAGNGDGGNGASLGPIISADGRFVVFESRADNLVDDDKNGARDVFVRDRASGETEMISRTPDGLPADGESWLGSMSADGRFVTYVTAATDIVKGEDTFGHAVLHDRDSGTATLLSQSIDGTPAEPGSYSNAAGISADGSVVVFWSDASNLVPGEDNGDFDVYVLDQRANTLDRISVAPDGTPADAGSFTAWASVSGDGRFVAFASTATNLTPDVAGAPTGSHAYVHDRATGTTTLVSATPDGGWANDSTGETGLAFDHDGRLVAFSSTASDLVPNDTNSQVDVFVRTRYGVG